MSDRKTVYEGINNSYLNCKHERGIGIEYPNTNKQLALRSNSTGIERNSYVRNTSYRSHHSIINSEDFDYGPSTSNNNTVTVVLNPNAVEFVPSRKLTNLAIVPQLGKLCQNISPASRNAAQCCCSGIHGHRFSTANVCDIDRR